ncbi:hypothetical protein E2C01_096659 [Portunus trituberculatus]|uniref:Uncharacterized protein n=1 Tax=Portunus trituberculatus TaxID=210409 RepID=A0A5B7K3C8_PORTR|nr:hypothetical protein [Portunus trituberculatus]
MSHLSWHLYTSSFSSHHTTHDRQIQHTSTSLSTRHSNASFSIYSRCPHLLPRNSNHFSFSVLNSTPVSVSLVYPSPRQFSSPIS